MQPPNLFDFATSELSQDAFVCWLASWADASCRELNRPLHQTATAFLDRLLEVGKGPTVSEYRSIQVRRQWNNIDVLLIVNGDTAVIVEDKIDTTDHSNQLDRYKAAVAGPFPPGRIAAVYLKTGDQGNYHTADQAEYGRFLRRDFLAVLDLGERAGVRSDIFADFHRHLRRVEAAVQSYQSAQLDGWDGHNWRGFFLALQDRLGRGDWNYVANPSGGFIGFWWHSRGDRYLQLENDKLCFKITVPDESQQRARWWEWHNALMATSEVAEVRITKPARRGRGTTMTVAVLDGDYRQSDPEGRLDMGRTVDVLRKAEALMDAALDRPPSRP